MRLLLLALALLAAGCADADAPATTTASATTDAAPAPTDVADAPAATTGLPPDLSGLNLQVNHPTGSVLRVTGVRFGNDHIAVDVEFTNGMDREQVLNQHRNNYFVVRDNLGNVYNVSPPPNNAQVAVPARQSISGEFVFLGRLHPDATGLTLVTNERFGSDSNVTTSPKMTIEIPVSS